MAFSSYSIDTNYEVQVPLRIEYSGGPFVLRDKYGAFISNKWSKYERRARKTFSYKGMTEAAAKSCVDAMNARYTRKFMSWTQSGFDYYSSADAKYTNLGSRANPDYFQNVAEINVTRRTVVFDVQVTVDETIVMYLKTKLDVNNATDRIELERQFKLAKNSYLATYEYDEPAAVQEGS